jgi:adenine-specific DNA-methyltransferase
MMAETQPEILDYSKKKYETSKSGNFDIYVLFVERGFKILNSKGKLGYILPHKFFQSDFGVGLRNFISHNRAINEIVDFGVNQVFEQATTYTCILFLDKNQSSNFKYIKINSIKNPTLTFNVISDNKLSNEFEISFLKQPSGQTKWSFINSKKENLVEKLKKQKCKLEDVVEKIFQGIPTGADNIFIIEVKELKKSIALCYSKAIEKEFYIESNILKPFLFGRDVKRYKSPIVNTCIIFPYDLRHLKPLLISKNELINKFPLTWEYFNENKQVLINREKGRFKETFWQFSRPQNLSEFFYKKIMMPHIGDKPEMTIDKTASYTHTANVYSYIFKKSIKESDLFFLGVLNSKLFHFFEINTGTLLRGGYINFKPTYVNPFPIKLIDFDNISEVKKHDEIVKLVDQLLNLNEEKATTKLETKINQINSKIDYCESRINEIVYQLYDLTAEEIKIVEGK